MAKRLYKIERKNIYPAKPKYALKSLKDAASFLKKQINSKESVSKMNKSQLINFLSNNGYSLAELATIKKVKEPRPRQLYINSSARKNVFPAKPKYKLKSLKDAASFLKKQINSKESVSKMNKSQLINFLSNNGYSLSELATPKKVNVPGARGRLPSTQKLIDETKKLKKKVRTTEASIQQMMAPKRGRGRPKGSKNKPKT